MLCDGRRRRGETTFSGTRTVRPADVAVPRGYRIDVVATGLTFPTGVAFDESGTPYVTESGYSYGEVFTAPRLLRVNGDGSTTEVARGSNNGPWTGVARAGNGFIVAEGGTMQGGRIVRLDADGKITALIENLPTRGDHHTNGPAIASDGSIYFGQGVATNSRLCHASMPVSVSRGSGTASRPASTRYAAAHACAQAVA